MIKSVLNKTFLLIFTVWTSVSFGQNTVKWTRFEAGLGGSVENAKKIIVEI